MIAVQSARMSTVRRNLDLLQSTFSMQQNEYMNLQRTSKQLDRALAKAFQHLESSMHVIEATYRYGHMHAPHARHHNPEKPFKLQSTT